MIYDILRLYLSILRRPDYRAEPRAKPRI